MMLWRDVGESYRSRSRQQEQRSARWECIKSELGPDQAEPRARAVRSLLLLLRLIICSHSAVVAGAHQHPFNLSQWGAFLWSARDRICLVISQAGPATGVPGASSPSCLHRGICCCQPAPRIVSVVVDCVPRCLPFLFHLLLILIFLRLPSVPAVPKKSRA